MFMTTDNLTPKPGQGVYYFDEGQNPITIYFGLVKTVKNKSMTVLVPNLHGIGWDYSNPQNIVTFTWRASKKLWGRKSDGLPSSFVFFLEPFQEAQVVGAFESLGGI